VPASLGFFGVGERRLLRTAVCRSKEKLAGVRDEVEEDVV